MDEPANEGWSNDEEDDQTLQHRGNVAGSGPRPLDLHIAGAKRAHQERGEDDAYGVRARNQSAGDPVPALSLIHI